MPNPLVDFEQNYRVADTLLKVYRLLDADNGPQTENAMMERIRDLLMTDQHEELILLINGLFLGVVREAADIRPAVFRKDNLCMLLRQAIVAACSALDVYFPALLQQHLSLMLWVKQKNFIPQEKTVKDLLKSFNLGVEDIVRLINDPHPQNILADLIVDHMKGKTLSNSQGLAVTLLFLGVEDPLDKIALRLALSKDTLIKQFDGLVARRNDIVHRGDRSGLDPDGPPQEILYSWTYSHIQMARSVIQAAHELVEEQIRSFPAPVNEPGLPFLLVNGVEKG